MEKATATTETGIASRACGTRCESSRSRSWSRPSASGYAPWPGRYAFRVNDYYAGLIDWSDPERPDPPTGDTARRGAARVRAT